MKKKCILIFILAIIGKGIAEEVDRLACCPRSTFIILSESFYCYNPDDNTTRPNRLGCGSYLGSPDFRVRAGVIEYEISEKKKVTVGPSIACHGDLYWKQNITLIQTYEPIHIFLVCADKDPIDLYSIDQYCKIVSVIFLSLTALIYAVFSDLRDLFGKSVTNFCGSLAIGMALFATDIDNVSSCAARGYSGYFFFVAAFFWSNSIAIQVLMDTRRTPTVDHSWKEFRWYFLYSWGFPAILTTIMAIVDHHPGEHKKPGFGDNFCWFKSKSQEWYYLNSVMTVLLVINLAIFIFIAKVLWRHSFKSTHLKTLRFRLSMTIRLILVMGLPWMIRMLKRSVGNGSFSWFVLDMMTTLQGILVFLVLVVRKRVVRVLNQRGLLACCSGPVERWLAVPDDEACDIPPDDLQTDVPMQE